MTVAFKGVASGGIPSVMDTHVPYSQLLAQDDVFTGLQKFLPGNTEGPCSNQTSLTFHV